MYRYLDNNELSRRGKEYSEFWYGIYQKLRDPEKPFKCMTKEDDVHVYVDQSEGTITVGPYFIRLDTKEDTYVEDERIFYNELSKKVLENYDQLSLTEDTLFAKFLSIDNVACEGEPWFVDKNGKKITFPNFVDGQPFYIRFKPANDGYISEVNIKNEVPEIKCEYYSNFNGTKQTSEVVGIAYPWRLTGEIYLHDDPDSPFNTYIVNPQFTRPSQTTHVGTPYQGGFLISSNELKWNMGFISVEELGRSYVAYEGEGTIVTQACLQANDLVFWKFTGNYNWSRSNMPATYVRYTVEEREWDPDHDNGDGTFGDWVTIDSWDGERSTAGMTEAEYDEYIKSIREAYKDEKYVLSWDCDFSWSNSQLIDKLYKYQTNYFWWGDFMHNEYFNHFLYIGDGSLPLWLTKDMVDSGILSDGLLNVLDALQTRERLLTAGRHGRIETETKLVKKGINMQIQGTVYMDGPSIKNATPNGIFDGADNAVGGVEVRLYRLDTNELAATTITDKAGRYWFFGKRADTEPLINPMYKYYVVFIFNGQLYEQTTYEDNIASPGGHSNAREDGGDRAAINARFSTINATPNNYNGSSEAFAYHAQIRDKSGNGQGMTYASVWAKFLEDGANLVGTVKDPEYADYNVMWKGGEFDHNYEEVYAQVNAGAATGDVVNYIRDCMIRASSDLGHAYPQYDQFVIESVDTENTRFKGKVLVPNYSNLTDADYEKVTVSVPGATDKEKRLAAYDSIYSEIIEDASEKTGVDNPTDVEVEDDGTVTIRRVKPGSKDKITYDEVDFDFDMLGIKYYHLYSIKSAQCFWVDYGMKERIITDLALQKDLHRVWVIFNGKEEIYKYSDKAEPSIQLYDDTSRRSLTGDTYTRWDYGGMKYQRKIRASDYLYRAQDYGEPEIKNMQVYVTYRIAIKNQGGTNVTLNEVVDYYDADMYSFDGDGMSPKQHTSNLRSGPFVLSYIVHDSGGYNADSGDSITVSQTSRTGESETVNGLSTLYLSGFGDLAPGELKYAYVTFKVNNDAAGRIKLDQDLYSGALKGGKRNIAEVNSYSTAEGIVDVDSNPGNLMPPDFNGEDIDYSKVEDDTDQAPNFQIIILSEEEYIRRFKGYVFEDERTVTSSGSDRGDGIDNGETKVNGVTLELVELLAQVNGEGIFTGNYLGEKVWASLTYNDFMSAPSVDLSRYFSGSGLMKIIINGPGITEVAQESLGEGEYGFKSIPAGNWFIRFKYGDTTQTVLLTDEAATENTAKLSSTTDYSEPLQSVNDLLKTDFTRNDVKGLMATSGLNKKSYNGQDFKSTIYQPGLSQAKTYNGILGYQNYETQNYTDAAGRINNGTDKTSMYYYDISEGNTSAVVNDAKDVDARRLEVNAYSKGVNNDLVSSTQSVLNRRAEVLDSFERVLTHNSTDTDVSQRQQEALIEMMENTYMTAQTGVINTELEIERTSIDGIYDPIDYNVPNILLGLQERPRSQLIISKKVANFKLVLANNQVLFDANQAVNDLIYTIHEEHQPEEPAYTANKRLSGVLLAHKRKLTPELVQAALDDELMEGSRVDVTYKFTVRNTSEVDYVDKKFYYMGIEDHPAINIVKTAANGVIDYVSNMIKYDRNYQEENTEWTLRGPEYLIGSLSGQDINLDYVNSKYYDLVKDYNAILTTNKLGTELVPEKFEYSSGDPSSVDTTLILSTLISVNNGANNLVYNNLTEIISYANSVGRRMQYSVVGNQPMADQTERTDLSEDYVTLLSRVTPEEVDADSAQRIVLMPPTGENRDYAPVIVAITVALGIVGIAIFEIRKLLKK